MALGYNVRSSIVAVTTSTFPSQPTPRTFAQPNVHQPPIQTAVATLPPLPPSLSSH